MLAYITLTPLQTLLEGHSIDKTSLVLYSLSCAREQKRIRCWTDLLQWQWVIIFSYRVVNELLKNIREHLGCLYNLIECISMLDMLVSFAHNCTLSEYGQ